MTDASFEAPARAGGGGAAGPVSSGASGAPERRLGAGVTVQRAEKI